MSQRTSISHIGRLSIPSTMRTFLPENSRAIALSFFRTFFRLTRDKFRVRFRSGFTLPHLLAGHDKRTADIPVLDEPFAVRQLQLLRQVERSDPRGVGDGNDNVHR